MNHIGIYTGMQYTKPALKQTMRPTLDMTQYATGREDIEYGPRPQLPPAPVDPAYEAFMRGEDSRGTYVPEVVPVEDDSLWEAEKLDRGMLR